MHIDFKQLSQQVYSGKYSSSGWVTNLTEIENKDISVIMLCILYHNQQINHESFVARMKQYKDGLLDRRVGTYKSNVTGEWYQDTTITDILIDEVHDSCNNKDLTIDEYLKYLNIGFNRNRNYCVDFIAFNIFKPVINHYNRYWANEFLNACNIPYLDATYLSFEEADRKYDLSSGYCCEYHDGCIKQYKQSRYEWLYKKDDIKALKESLQNALLKYKKHLKNPDDKLLYHW